MPSVVLLGQHTTDAQDSALFQKNCDSGARLQSSALRSLEEPSESILSQNLQFCCLSL